MQTKKSLYDKVDKMYQILNETQYRKFAEIITSPRHIFWRSFLAGVARGIGTAIGFSILGAILIYIFRSIVMLNIPVIGAFVKDIWEIIQNH